MARDKKSVLLKAEGDEAGWWLRTDARRSPWSPRPTGRTGGRRSQQIVLRGLARLDAGAKLRWKLAPVASR